MSSLERHRAGILSAFTAQELGTLGERLVTPIICLMTVIVMPNRLTPVTGGPVLTFAIGRLYLLRNVAWAVVNGPKVPAHAEKAIAPDPKNAAARIIAAASTVYPPGCSAAIPVAGSS